MSRNVQSLPRRYVLREPKPGEIHVADGCGNSYSVWRNATSGAVVFEYEPITPMMSSSGTYSGGEPVYHEGRVSDVEFERLDAAVAAAAADDSARAATRMKGTYVLTRNREEGSRPDVVIIKFKASVLDGIDALLQSFMNR